MELSQASTLAIENLRNSIKFPVIKAKKEARLQVKFMEQLKPFLDTNPLNDVLDRHTVESLDKLKPDVVLCQGVLDRSVDAVVRGPEGNREQ